nr:lignin-forming anionic peroxidase-like [Ipomoea batatas]
MASHTTPCIAALSCLFVLLSFFSQCQAQLSPTFYENTCPNALNIIHTAVRQAVSTERRMAASLGYDVIEAAKGELEKACPGIVSCADVLSVAARDATVAVGGPSWTVKLGRRDSTMASRTIDLPSPFANLDMLISSFASKCLNTRDMVALSGAHTLGQAQCFLFRDRIYGNRTDIDADQVLFSSGATDSIVSEYAMSPQAFQADFASAIIKMSEIQPLTGQNGSIRKICSALN